jgi:hypothetical protein
MATTALRTDQAQGTGAQRALRRGSRDRRREALAGYLFISPWIIGFLLLKSRASGRCSRRRWAAKLR